jgi:benzoate transport
MNIHGGLDFRHRPMSRTQLLVVGLCALLNVLDGFDLQSIAFVGPILSSQWRLSPKMLGILFTLGLAGIAVGAPLLALAADRFGRRRTILICLTLITASVFGSSLASDVVELGILRFCTGAGIGGMLASINTMVAEYSSDRRRDLSISITMAGFPVGGTVGGILAVFLVSEYDWRAVFVTFGVISALMIPVVYFFMPESLDYLEVRHPPNALQRINAVRRRMQESPIAALASPELGAERVALKQLVRSPLLRSTVFICSGFLAVPLSFYFLLSWMPKLLVDSGFSVAGGISSSVLMNLGGIFGGVGYGLIALRLGRRRVAIASMLLGFIGATVFGFLPQLIGPLLLGSSIVGVFIFAAFTSLYALVPSLYPAGVRASGTGIAMGVGRIGALLGPYLGGLLIAAAWSAEAFLVVMTLPFLLGALAIRFLPNRADNSAL